QEYNLPVTFAAQLTNDPSEVLSRVEARRMDPTTQMGLIAAREAWANAGLADEQVELDPERLAVAFGTGIGGVWTLLDSWDNLRERGPRRVLPMTVPMLMPNGAAAAISMDISARGRALTTVSACDSGTEAMDNARRLIESGEADVGITCGADAAIHPMPNAGFDAMQALARSQPYPEAAPRPDDNDRDGFVPGEGAGALLIESEEHAKARGATVYAVLAGSGVTSDAHHITAPEPEGLGASRALTAALKSAGIELNEVVHV